MCECIADVHMSVKIKISTVEALKVARAAYQRNTQALTTHILTFQHT
jgi:hypothetical protein